jgi:hypothetical protein
MSVLHTVLVYVVIPAAVYLGIALIVAGPRLSRRPRYRVGRPWTHEPLFWSGNPEGTGLPPGRRNDPDATVGRGGARGEW